jgi:AcrR family transcriptional regulator
MADERAQRGTARERLLAAAALLTYTGGIEATGVDAIARAAGVTKRTLYQHFRSKDELVAASLAMRDAPAIAALRGAVERRVARGARPVDALFRALGRLFESDGYRGCAFVNAGLEMTDPAHPVHPVARSHTDARGALVAELCRAEGVDDPAVHDAVRLIAEGAFAMSVVHRDASVAERAGAAARRLLDAYA